MIRALARALALGLASGVLWANAAQAAIQRYALLVANNDGDKGTVPLVFAHDDLDRMRDVLEELGGYEEDQIVALTGENRRDLLAAFGAMRTDIAEAQAAGDEVVFLFYYSGHADDDRLQLGTSELTYDELEAMLDKSGAEVRLAFIDACQSGALTRAKGGTRAPSFVFDVSERLGAQGTVIITSSTGDESSQESDEIGGSYFTHYLVSGLYGAADRNRDEVVTLAEAYDYVYNETVLRTSGTRSGAQHPSVGWDLGGGGDLVLTDLDSSRATLIFPEGLVGAFAVFDVTRRAFVAEVDLLRGSPGDRRLAIRPGRYQIQERFPTHLRVSDVVVRAGERVDVSGLAFESVEYEDDVAKGTIDKKLKRARLPDSSFRLVSGAFAPLNGDVLNQYIPAMVMGGASWRLNWRDGRWLSVDLMGGGASSTITIPDLEPEPVAVGSALVGAGAGWSTAPRQWQAGVGIRLDMLYIGRSFTADLSLPDQQLTALSPGVEHWVGWHPGKLEFDLAWRVQAVPITFEDRDRGFFMHQVLIAGGYRF